MTLHDAPVGPARAAPPRQDVAPARGSLRLPRGAFIFEEGQSGGFAYIVETGEVEIVKVTPSGGTVLACVGPGSLFGEMAVIDGSPRSASARAATDVSVREIDRAAFLHHIQARPDTALKMMTRLAGYVRSSNRSASVALAAADTTATEAPTDGAAADGGRRRDGGRLSEVVADPDALYEDGAGRRVLGAAAALMAFVLAGVAFMALSFVDTTVRARGKVTTLVPNVVVQASSDARIEALEVGRGQVVREGDLVARLDGTFVNANLAVVEEKHAAVMERLNRIGLEQHLMNAPGQAVAEAAGGLDSVNRDILRKRIDEYRSRLSSFDAQLSRLDQEIAAARETVAIYAEQLGVKRQVEEARRTLYDQEVGSLLNYLVAKDDRLEARRRLQDAENAVRNLQSQRLATVAERDAFVAHWSANLAEQQSAQEETRVQLREDLVKLRRQAEDLSVRAPANGIVLNLPQVSQGSIVRSGDPLLTLVRTDVPLAVDVDVDPRDVSDLRVGAPVSVKLDALPFQQFGDLPGRLVYVSDDTHPESLHGDKGAFYRARIELDDGLPARLPEDFRLTPGMLATADLKVGERRLITYFTNPIVSNFSTAFNEPD